MDYVGRIERAIDAFNKGDHDLALTLALIAVDKASQKFYHVHKSAKKNYIRFLQQHDWLIERFGHLSNGAMNEKRDVQIDNGSGKIISTPCLAEIIYHEFRCNSAHGNEIPSNFSLINIPGLCIESDDPSIDVEKRCFNVTYWIVWGLLAACVFNVGAKNVTYNGDYFLEYKSLAAPEASKPFEIQKYIGKAPEIKKYLDALPAEPCIANRIFVEEGKKLKKSELLT